MARLLGHLCRLGLALVFLYAGLVKSLDPEGFTREVAAYGLLEGGAARILAYLLVPVEVALGTALLLDYRRILALLVACGLLVVFMGAIGYALATGQELQSCGCFGSSAPRTPQQTLLEDTGFLGAGLFALGVFARGGRGRAAPRRHAGRAGGGWKRAVFAAVTLGSGAFVIASPHLPIDDYATSLRAGVTWRDLEVAVAETDLSQGDHLVALLGLTDEASLAALEPLNALAAEGRIPVVALHSDDEAAYTEFFWTRGPAFPLHYITQADLNRLHRSLPRFFLVSGGEVRGTWSAPPDAAQLAEALP